MGTLVSQLARVWTPSGNYATRTARTLTRLAKQMTLGRSKPQQQVACVEPPASVCEETYDTSKSTLHARHACNNSGSNGRQRIPHGTSRSVAAMPSILYSKRTRHPEQCNLNVTYTISFSERHRVTRWPVISVIKALTPACHESRCWKRTLKCHTSCLTSARVHSSTHRQPASMLHCATA